MFLRVTGGPLQMPVTPSGTEIAFYHTYVEAQAVADLLFDEEFDVKSIMIVGIDLHLVERVIGRPTMAEAAPSGTPSGALQGAFMGLMTSFASTNQSVFLQVPFGTAGSALAGTLMSGLLYTMTGRHRGFASQS